MIDLVQYRNFQALRNVDVKLGRLTVVAGANASGKTSVLRGVEFLTSLIAEAAAKRSFDPPWLRDLPTAAPALQMTISLRGLWSEAGSVTFEYESNEPIEFLLSKATWGGEEFDLYEAKSPDVPQHLNSLKAVLTATPVLHLNPRRCAEPAAADGPVPRVGPDGAGLASVLAEMLVAQSGAFEFLTECLRSIFPAVERVRLRRALVPPRGPDGKSLWGHEIQISSKRGGTLPARLAGDGVLLVLSLLAVILGPDRPRVVLFDDLERGLTPTAQTALVRCLRLLLDRFGDLQIITTSRSPTVLDHFERYEVRLLGVDELGKVWCASPDEGPSYELWQTQMASLRP
jgi:putative AbiEii toxin of type IV toxin-antitoxin system